MLTRLLVVTGVIDRRFRNEAKGAFAFLREELGIDEPQFHADAFGATLTYHGQDIAVKVALDKSEYSIDVYVIRLRDGEIPLLVEEPQDWIYLSSLVAMRAPELTSSWDRVVDGSSEHLRRHLSAAADALRTYGRDALAGDSAVYKETAKRFPQPRRRRQDYVAPKSAPR